jgi:uncharacterized membrane protein
MAVPLTLEFRDYGSNSLVADTSVALTITEQATGLSYDVIASTNAQGLVTLEVPDNALLIDARVDAPDTPGADYHSFSKVNPSLGSSPIFLEPVGTVRGEVVDTNGNGIPGVEIKIDCTTGSNTGTTDEFGAFSATVPAGSCRVLARSGSNTGISDFNVVHGEVTTTRISINNNLFSPITSHPLWWVAGLLFIIIVEGAAIAYLVYYRKKAVPAAKKPMPKDNGLESIMRTLSDRESAIVKHLFANEGKSNQARIHKELGIPKTSLIRALQSLERKKIIETQKDRKLINVSLTSWIMLKK